MAQEEHQAKYSGMPGSAIDTGLVDFALPVEQMPGALIKYVLHPHVKPHKKPLLKEDLLQNQLQKIFLLIRASSAHDFSNYKQNTIRRRIERRMAVHQIITLGDYVRYLQHNPAEIQTLTRDFLISVTNFFRDKDAFESLAEKAIKKILAEKENDSPIRIWVPGCATGEEAYSIAILVKETMEEMKKHLDVQVFATDLDPESIEYARAATYPESIAAEVSSERINRFFVKKGDSYVIRKQTRDMVVFAVHNIIKDPPFSRLDLISCRNVLIYMNTVLQKKIIPLFHFVLNPGEYLFLGTSESIGAYSDLFMAEDIKWKVFRRKDMFPARGVGAKRGLIYLLTTNSP